MKTDGYDVEYTDQIGNDRRKKHGARITDLRGNRTVALGGFDTIPECQAWVREWIYEQEKQHGGS